MKYFQISVRSSTRLKPHPVLDYSPPFSFYSFSLNFALYSWILVHSLLSSFKPPAQCRTLQSPQCSNFLSLSHQQKARRLIGHLASMQSPLLFTVMSLISSPCFPKFILDFSPNSLFFTLQVLKSQSLMSPTGSAIMNSLLSNNLFYKYLYMFKADSQNPIFIQFRNLLLSLYTDQIHSLLTFKFLI